MTEQTVKLQKYVSDCGLMSRRAAEAAIVRGEFTVNGLPATLGDRVLPSRDVVRYRGRKLRDPGRKWYIMLNKPRGYVTTMADERGRKSVAELVSDLPARVYPVGRLDMDSEGLLLMTNDGEFANRLAHPSFGPRKGYVTVAGCVGNGEADRLRTMRELDGEPIASCEVHILERNVNSSRLRIVLTQGKNRQIRRMAERVGLKVTALRRVAVGCVTLGELESGRWKELSPQQVRARRGQARAAPAKRYGTLRLSRTTHG